MSRSNSMDSMTDGGIDYSGYTLREVEEALARINPDKYPLNFANLRAAYERLNVYRPPRAAGQGREDLSQRLPFDFVKATSVLWLLTTPLLMLAALISKASSRFYTTQLGVVTIICLFSLLAVSGALRGKAWARIVLLILSIVAASFWLVLGSDKIATGIGLGYAVLSSMLLFSERRPR